LSDKTETQAKHTNEDMTLQLVVPEDGVSQDKAEMSTIQKWAEHHGVHVSSIPGKLFCHEESPALSATILHEFVSKIS
jgi:hypothetical protein